MRQGALILAAYSSVVSVLRHALVFPAQMEGGDDYGVHQVGRHEVLVSTG